MVLAKLRFWIYRLGTVARSFKTLYSLPKSKLEAFLNSYIIYDHDWTNEEAMIQAMGPDYRDIVKQKLIDYYSVLNHLCAIGQVEKMYIPPALDLRRSIIDNQTLFEKRMWKDLGIGRKSKVLDVGCGRGRIASHAASHTGASVEGINLDKSQLESARKFAKGDGLDQLTHFQPWDVNQSPYPFEEATFDAIYEVQVFSLAKDLDKTFQELYRLLKPGGKFACLEWVVLDGYDHKNPYHGHLMKQVKPLIGAIGNPTIDKYVKALEKAGFTVIINENASLNGLQSPLIEKADKFYTRIGKLINLLVRFKILPRHFNTLFERLSRGGDAFVEADKLRLVSTSHYIVAKK